MPRESLGATRRGVTLAELLVVIAILGLIAGVAVRALSASRRDGPERQVVRSLMAARAEAIRTRRPVVVRVGDSSSTGVATALPDGSITSEIRARASAQLNSLTGRAMVRGDTGRARD